MADTIRSDTYTITIVSHTHWDRAWYVTFQEFRARLVRLVDRLIQVLDSDPDYRVFMLDGQMAVLEDYLEVRPQRKEKLVELCRNGRLRVGPWYVLADEFLVHPEALIRNMQLGHQMGKDYGGVSQIGYVPDGFGHIAQLPQIFKGFGIDNAFFWRGLGEEGDQLGTEFIWKAPDGSAVLAIWMPSGYHNISNLGYPIHWGDTSQMVFDPELALNQIQTSIEKLKPMGNTQAILLMNGIDHEEVEPRLPEIVNMANQQLKPYVFYHATLEEHLTAVIESKVSLPEFSGEFRWGKYSEILQGVYATRIHLKQTNHRIESLYINYAEPLSALAWLSGADIPEGTQDLLWTGWRWLLKNHPHDDIYGSGIDTVHDEMDYRFSQGEQIGEVIVRDSLRQFTREIDFSAQPGMPILVFNPLGWERDEIATGAIDFEFDDPAADNFRIVDSEGAILPHQVLEDREIFWMETLKANRKRRVRVAFPIRVPACGYHSVFVQAAQDSPQKSIEELSDWGIYPEGAENHYLSFHIQADGSLEIIDKLTNAVFTDLSYFEDVEDTGDEYSFCPLPDSQPITTQGKTASIAVLHNGDNLVTFEVVHTLHLPEGLAEDRKRRSEHLVETEIITHFTLYRDQPGIFVETEMNNQVRDHKLNVVFPTGLLAENVSVDQPFMVLDRQISLPASQGWVEDPTPLMHQRAFTDISQEGIGLAVFNRGLPAVEVTNQPGRSQGSETRIGLVLLRSVGWLSRDDLWNRRIAAGPLVPTPGAQCLGHYRFEYAIYPHAGNWQDGTQNSVIQAAYGYNAPLLVARADTHEGLDLREMNITGDDPNKVRTIPFPRAGKLPGMTSFFNVDRPELSLSSLHQPDEQIIHAGKAVVLRYVNISSKPIIAKLHSYLPVREAWQINLNEEPVKNLYVLDAHIIEFNAGEHEIVSLLLLMAG